MDISSLPKDEALKKIMEENVKVQVKNVAKNDVVAATVDVKVNGWVLDIEKGHLRDLKI
jgi:carbonic anhydrase